MIRSSAGYGIWFLTSLTSKLTMELPILVKVNVVADHMESTHDVVTMSDSEDQTPRAPHALNYETWNRQDNVSAVDSIRRCMLRYTGSLRRPKIAGACRV